jgi:BASS family bile acid:Na+ symporter
MTSLEKLLLRFSPVLLVVAVVLFAIDRSFAGGLVLTAFFLAASVGVRGSERLRGISYSLMIFGAVTFSMCIPAPFVAWGDFKLSALIDGLLARRCCHDASLSGVFCDSPSLARRSAVASSSLMNSAE